MFGRVFWIKFLETLWFGENKELRKKKDTNKKIIVILALKEKEHRFYEIRWHRGETRPYIYRIFLY